MIEDGRTAVSWALGGWMVVDEEAMIADDHSEPGQLQDRPKDHGE